MGLHETTAAVLGKPKLRPFATPGGNIFPGEPGSGLDLNVGPNGTRGGPLLPGGDRRSPRNLGAALSNETQRAELATRDVQGSGWGVTTSGKLVHLVSNGVDGTYHYETVNGELP